MNLKDDNGLHEDLASHVWYAKEDLHGVAKLIIDLLNPIRLEGDGNYAWIEFMAEKKFSNKHLFQLGVGKEQKRKYIGIRYLFQLCVGRREKN